MAQGDRPDSPAGVIRSLFQADPFPCSVASLGRADLFKALEPLAYARNPMATQNLIRAPGKRQISASPQPLTASIQPRCRITGYTQAIDTPFNSLYTRHSAHHFTYGSMTPKHNPNQIKKKVSNAQFTTMSCSLHYNFREIASILLLGYWVPAVQNRLENFLERLTLNVFFVKFNFDRSW